MRAVLQRVSHAEVSVVTSGAEPRTAARIGTGLLILLGIRKGDTQATAVRLAARVAGLRIFEDEEGRLNRSVLDVGGSALVVSNFTLYADSSRGRRPGFDQAAPRAEAEPLVAAFTEALRAEGVPVGEGVFGAEMRVSLVNDGPVTILLDTDSPAGPAP